MCIRDRPCEFLSATRRLLTLPQDVGYWARSAWLRILNAKNRLRYARRQLARSDEPLIVDLLAAVFGALPPASKLWPGSPSQFTSRWNAVCRALRIPARTGSGLTPASLRPGGATAMYLQDESLDNLRRRGRWARMATLEIYVQEVGPFEFLADLAPPVMEGLLAASASFELSLIHI